MNSASLAVTGLVRVSRARTKVTLPSPRPFRSPMRQVPLHGSHLLPRPSPAPVAPSQRLRSPSPGEGTGGSIPPGRETKAEARRPGGQASSGTAAVTAGRMARCIRGWEKGNQGSETSECLGCILPSAGLPGQANPEPSPAAPWDPASEGPPHSAHLGRSAPAPSDGSGESPAARARARALAPSPLRPPRAPLRPGSGPPRPCPSASARTNRVAWTAQRWSRGLTSQSPNCPRQAPGSDVPGGSVAT
jgi:hypothetical protein